MLWFSVQYLDTIEIASCCIFIWILSRMNYTNFVCNSMFCIMELFHEIALYVYMNVLMYIRVSLSYVRYIWKFSGGYSFVYTKRGMNEL